MGIERMHPPRYWRAKAEEFRAKSDNAEHPPPEGNAAGHRQDL